MGIKVLGRFEAAASDGIIADDTAIEVEGGKTLREKLKEVGTGGGGAVDKETIQNLNFVNYDDMGWNELKDKVDSLGGQEGGAFTEEFEQNLAEYLGRNMYYAMPSDGADQWLKIQFGMGIISADDIVDIQYIPGVSTPISEIYATKDELNTYGKLSPFLTLYVKKPTGETEFTAYDDSVFKDIVTMVIWGDGKYDYTDLGGVSISHSYFADGITYKVCFYGNVQKIPANVFRNNQWITKVVISEGVTRIGEAAFMGCSNLTSVELGQDVMYIEKDAFFTCPLEEIFMKPTTPPGFEVYTMNGAEIMPFGTKGEMTFKIHLDKTSLINTYLNDQQWSTFFNKYRYDANLKLSDWATKNTAGVVIVNADKGIGRANEHPTLELQAASAGEIDKKASLYKPIVPKQLDYAVKVGITTNTETLTPEEQARAQEWLGINDSLLELQAASVEEIDKKESSYKPIVPKRLDHAVKVGITTNTETLTPEEQARAQEWLGINDSLKLYYVTGTLRGSYSENDECSLHFIAYTTNIDGLIEEAAAENLYGNYKNTLIQCMPMNMTQGLQVIIPIGLVWDGGELLIYGIESGQPMVSRNVKMYDLDIAEIK